MVQTVDIFGDFCFIREDAETIFSVGEEARLEFINADSNYYYLLTARGSNGYGFTGTGGNGVVWVKGPLFSQDRSRVQIAATAEGGIGFGSNVGGGAEVRYFNMDFTTPTLSLSATATGGDSQDATQAGSASISIDNNSIAADNAGSSFVFSLQIYPSSSPSSSSIVIAGNGMNGGAGNDYWTFMYNGVTPTRNWIGSNQFLFGAGNDVFTIWGTTITAPDLSPPGPDLGLNQFDGGDGFDIFRFDCVGGITVDLFRDGFSNFEQVEGSAFADSITADDIDNYLYGFGGNDFLSGQAGNDLLVGGEGNDAMNGGLGIDTASFIDSAGAVVVDLGVGTSTGNGTDSLTMIENVIGSNHDDTITGDFYDNRLEGRDGNDALNGGVGNDVLLGGLGDDLLDGGFTGIDWADYSDLENLISDVGIAVDLRTINPQDTVRSGMDTLISIENVRGSLDDDAIIGNDGANWIYGEAGDDILQGLGGDDIIDGGDGNDLIDGGAGHDGMSGGNGDDIFIVDESGEIINEYIGGGVDVVRSTADYALTGYIETLELLGTGDIDGKGTDLDNVLIGNDGANQLDGAGGADLMVGGLGNDTYFVERGADGVVEGADEGVDTVISSISYTLGDNLEALTLADKDDPFGLGNFVDSLFGGIFGFSNNTDGTGNGLANLITGNTGNNMLLGLAGADVLIGGAGNDTLDGGDDDDSLNGGIGIDLVTGGAGTDTFVGTIADFSGDTITDFTAGEQLIFTDADIATFTFSLDGTTLTFTGGSLTLANAPFGHLVARAVDGGGVQIIVAADVHNDFNGDGRSDVLWRSVNGTISDWLGQADGSFVNNDVNAQTPVPLVWQIAATGDFNGDGRDDILWRSTNGTVSDWLGQADGGFDPNDSNALTPVPLVWQIAGTGDFNGDGRDDILWRSTNGTLSDWLAQANGGFADNDVNAQTNVSLLWQVAGIGDFNGDGRDDILWRSDNGALSDWLGQANGGFANNDASAFINVATNWHVVGTGDFNGDGRDDILWRSDTGQISNWLGTATGGFTNNDSNAFTAAPTNWHVVAVGDYNGDGRDDILWRSDTGQLSNWLGTESGGFDNNDANALIGVSTNWLVQPEHPLL